MFDILFARADHHQRASRHRGTVVSVLAHGAVIAVLLWAGRDADLPLVEAGAGEGITLGNAGGGGGGGERVTFYEVVPPPAPEVTAPPPVLPPVEPVVKPPVAPVPPTPQTDTAASAPPAPAASGSGETGSGAGAGPGEGPGTGPGSGGGSGGGTGGGIGSGTGSGTGSGRITPPETDLLLIPPPRPKNMSSRTVVFLLEVDTQGVVRKVELQPPTGDRRYDAALRRMALEWRFRPARDAANQPVAVKYPVTLHL